MPSWRDLAKTVDNAVDAQWSERYEFVPWKENDFSGGEDHTRSRIEFVGVPQHAEAVAAEGGGMTARMQVEQIWISAVIDQLAAGNPDQGDHIIMLEHNNEEYMIDRITDDPTGRSRIYLEKYGT